ncbi:MAG: hypothetical protein M2R45_00289 [Verrucomicrobia subdivision 3 bacterium]|nr:hypothetical protein [Limisphaerales bacterium]MCS1412951.1 hypothetical protein [Limisphaerales bacterium]
MKTDLASHREISVAFRQMQRISWLLLLTLFFAETATKSHADSAGEAKRYFQEGRYEDALEIYRYLSLENPDDPRFTYNAGVAAYRAGQMTDAVEQFDAASLAPDLKLQQQAHYNMGNSLFRLGESAADPEQKMAAWKQAIQRYQHAVTINEADTLAQENLDFVKRRLEELQQQQQNNGQQKPQEPSGDQNQEQEQESQPQPNESEQQHEPKQQDSQPSEAQQSGEDKKDSYATEPSPGKMTPEQAKQLLDAERDQARAMIFRPPQKRLPRNAFKDW